MKESTPPHFSLFFSDIKKPAKRVLTAMRLCRTFGADGRSRTGTACATRPSSVRVYQFHHIGKLGYFGISAGASSLAAGATLEPPGISTGAVSAAEEFAGAVIAVGTIDFTPEIFSG